MSDRFEDERGVIQDLLTEAITSVTRIDTVAGAVRGNHVHYQTTQWTYIVSGRMRMVTHWPGSSEFYDQDHGPGALLRDDPGYAHAWKALEDTTVLVFTRGPRSGENYESDTVRLKPEDRLL
jgi:dTDP-4-dehydrorhamnose 3,5-epimerase-like enzyme